MVLFKRIDLKNPFWWFTLCGCLPILGLIQSAIVIAPNIVWVIVSTTLTNIILFPRDIYYIFHYIINT
jgi:hypothetical protein